MFKGEVGIILKAIYISVLHCFYYYTTPFLYDLCVIFSKKYRFFAMWKYCKTKLIPEMTHSTFIHVLWKCLFLVPALVPYWHRIALSLGHWIAEDQSGIMDFTIREDTLELDCPRRTYFMV